MMFRRGYSIAVLAIVAASVASTVDAFNLRSEWFASSVDVIFRAFGFLCHSFDRIEAT